MTEQWDSIDNPHIDTIVYAVHAHRQGQNEKAKRLYLQALREAQEQKDPEKQYVVTCNFSELLIDLEEFDEAERLLRDAIKLKHENPESVNSVLSASENLQGLLQKCGKLSEVETVSLNELNRALGTYGPDSFEYNMASMSTAKMYWNKLGDLPKCREYFEAPLRFARGHSNSKVRKVILMNYSGLLVDAKQFDEAKSVDQELKR